MIGIKNRIECLFDHLDLYKIPLNSTVNNLKNKKYNFLRRKSGDYEKL